MYLDDNKINLIKKLKKLYPESGYVLANVDELTDENYCIDNLISDVRFLNESGFIDLKYCDAKELCLRITAKSIDFLSSLNIETDLPTLDDIKYFKQAFIGAFIGAIAAFTLIVAIITVIYAFK